MLKYLKKNLVFCTINIKKCLNENLIVENQTINLSEFSIGFSTHFSEGKFV